MKNLTVWIVGASSGIGLELVTLWLAQGHNVIASSRNATTSHELHLLQYTYTQQLRTIDIDASTSSALESIIDEVWGCFGGIDLWFYNAGAYDVMKIDQWSETSFSHMNEVNYMGAVRIMIPLSKKFLAQGHGQWVWNISLSAYFGLPYGGAYSAPKAALLNLAESIQPELKSHGIDLHIINHGFVKTRLTQKNDFTMPQLMEPKDAAKIIANALVQSNCFEIRFPTFLSSFLALLRMLPYRISLFLTSKALR